MPVKGGWGLRGATNVRLGAATAATLRPALEVAWRNVAPPKSCGCPDGAGQRAPETQVMRALTSYFDHDALVAGISGY